MLKVQSKDAIVPVAGGVKFHAKAVIIESSASTAAIKALIKGMLDGTIVVPEKAEGAAIHAIVRVLRATHVTHFEVPALALEGGALKVHKFHETEMQHDYYFWPLGLSRKGEPTATERLPYLLSSAERGLLSTVLLAFASETGLENRIAVKAAITELADEMAMAKNMCGLACRFIDKITVPPSPP